MTELAENLRLVQERIRAACGRRGRDPGVVELVAVSKGQGPEGVEAMAAAGQLLFGENRVQEAKTKSVVCSSRLRWHMVGHLQTNKCRDAVGLFEMVHAVDSLRLALELDKWAERASRRLAILLEVNVAGESTKFGYAPERVLAEVDAVAALRHVELQGLMGMAPWSPDPERSRPVFSRLRDLRVECEQRLGVGLRHLSMGMSGDFEVAVEEGATLVRVGTALFGERKRVSD